VVSSNTTDEEGVVVMMDRLFRIATLAACVSLVGVPDTAGAAQPGEVNFSAIQAWNAASVYQQAIALIGDQIDGREGVSARR
jgi:membrane-bound lytic murein transglycosylase B